MDKELKVMKSAYLALAAFDPLTRKRMLRWINEKFESDDREALLPVLPVLNKVVGDLQPEPVI